MSLYTRKHDAVSPRRNRMRKIVAVAAVLTVVLLGFSITAFAWFQSSLTNSGNTIEAGGYTAELAIYPDSFLGDPNTEPVWTYSGDEYRGTVNLTELGLHANDGIYVVVSTSEDSTLAFQYRILIASTGGKELALPQEGQENPVLEPGDGIAALDYVVPSDGKITIDFRTAFRANSLTAGTTSASTATTTTVATTTTTTSATATTTAAPATTTTTTTAAPTTTTTTTTAAAETTTTTTTTAAPDTTADTGSTEPSSPAGETVAAPEATDPTGAPSTGQAEGA